MKSITRQPVWRRFSARIVLGTALAFSILALRPGVLAQSGGSNEHWVGTWATAVVARAQNPAPPAQPPQGQGLPAFGQAPPAPAPFLHFSNQTLRQIVHTSIGGERVRVGLSNAFGTAPLVVGGAHLARREKEATIVPGGRALTFGGNSSITIPAGATVLSDPVDLKVPPLADLAIDLYLPWDTNTPSPLTIHTNALQTNYVSQPGSHVGASAFPVRTTTTSWFLLSRVEVVAPESVGAIVAIGDSITDGSRSTPNTNNRWPDHLARRLAAANIKMGVLNVGIGGNRVLTDGAGVNALARFDRDVLVQSGVTHVIVLEGINDIGLAKREQRVPPTAGDLIAGHRQLIERAHARGLKIYAGTLTPFEGTTVVNYWSPEGDATRQALNQWIRTSRAYDAVIDFDAVVRDPNQPMKILPRYDPGDALHPNDAGYKAMAEAIDLGLLKAGQRTPDQTAAVGR